MGVTFPAVAHSYQSTHTYLFVPKHSQYCNYIALTYLKYQQPHGGGFVLGTSSYSTNSITQVTPEQGSAFVPGTSTYLAGTGISQGLPANSGNFIPNPSSPFATTAAFSQPQPFPESTPVYQLQPLTSAQVCSILRKF